MLPFPSNQFPYVFDPSIRDKQINLNLPPPYRIIHVMERPTNFMLDFHAHEWYHVNYLISGRIHIYLNDTVTTAVEGQAFILPPFIPHKLQTDTGYAQLGMDIWLAEDQRGISSLVQDTFGQKLSIVTIEPIQRNFDELYHAIQNLSRLDTLRLINTAEGVLLDIVETAQLGSNVTFKKKFLQMLYQLDPCCVTLDEMCAYMNLSKTHLERLVKKEFNCCAMEYCNKLKLSKVCRLLQMTDMTIKELAEKVGFYDESHLNLFFKKRMAITPRKFRLSIGGQSVKNLYANKECDLE